MRARFPDIIDHHGQPSAAEDWSVMPFADQGAWFGFALTPADSLDESASFAGPFLHDRGLWLGPSIAALVLPDLVPGPGRALPGVLRRESWAGDLRVDQSLWFDSARQAILSTVLVNTGEKPQQLSLSWSGELFPGQGSWFKDTEGLAVHLEDGSRLLVGGDLPRDSIRVDGLGYRLDLPPVELSPGDSRILDLTFTLQYPEDARPALGLEREAIQSSRRENRDRWEGYLRSLNPDGEFAILGTKCLQTLVGNWRAPRGRLLHAGLFPSSNVWYFNGFWAWDSWKHVVGLSPVDGDLAAEQMRLMFDHQDEQGMVADVVYLDPAEDNWRNSKPPLAGWALESLYEEHGDLDLVRDLYPALVRFHRFWYERRDHDGDGLCEYGCTDGTLVAARWDSGMDNAVRFDDSSLLANGPGAWSLNQESVDLNSYLYRDKLALARLAEALGREDEAARWNEEAEALGALVRERMYDADSGWFYDIGVESGEFIPVQGPEGWIPLWAGLASADQAGRVRETLLDSTRFRTHVPFPTVSRAHPEFSEGYWRGLVWLDQACFAVQGLRNYGYGKDADALTRQIFDSLEGATQPGTPLYENYHPMTGKGQNVRHFSWTAAHLLMLAREMR